MVRAGRRRTGVSTLASSAAAMTLLGSAVLARRRGLSARETRAFRRVNGAPDHLLGPVWLAMQAGSLAAVPVVSACVWRRHGTRPAFVVLAAGTGVWAAVKLVKPLVGRGRPSDLLGDVRVRGTPQQGLGYPSGHAAVAATLAVATARRQSTCLTGLLAAGAVGTARLYVGAHLPLDVAGGLALGSLAGRLVRAWLQRP